MKKIVIASFLTLSFSGYSQTATTAPAAKEWDVSMYGFIRTDYIWDTRKSAQVREYNLNLYPLDKVLDANGDDINATDASNFLSVVSRLGVKVKGPDVWKAKMTGTLEGDFFGNTEGSPSSIGMFRLRHAYVNMDWSKTSLVLGQTWYPSFIPEVFPGVANFNTGIMFNPFGWATQVRIKQNFTKELSFALTAYKEREFANATASGGTQNAGSINSAIPTFHGQLQYKNKNWIAGLGAEYKSLQPLTESAGKVTNEKANSSSFLGYFKYSNDKYSIKGYGITGGNLYSGVMIGGYNGYTALGQQEQYKPTKTSAFWFDLASNGKKIAPGLFFGYTKNEGSDKNGLAVGETVKYYIRGISGTRVVDDVWRASARIDFKQNKFRVSPEIEYTAATWANLNANASGAGGINQTNVGNFRTVISCSYTF